MALFGASSELQVCNSEARKNSGSARTRSGEAIGGVVECRTITGYCVDPLKRPLPDHRG